MPKTRMFEFITGTWNPVGGACPYGCTYCWAQGKKGLKEKYNMRKYFGPPKLFQKELKRGFKHNDFIFVSDMIDLFAPNIPDEYILAVLKTITNNPQAQFLFLTKNPARYDTLVQKHGFLWPPNLVLGATIESDIHYPQITNAPPPKERLAALQKLSFIFENLPVWSTRPRLFVSIEPIMAFHFSNFIQELEKINLWAVAVGYDNYGHKLPEPTLEKTKRLINALERFTTVYIKTIRPAWFETEKIPKLVVDNEKKKSEN